MWRSAAGPASTRNRVIVVGTLAALALGGCSASPIAPTTAPPLAPTGSVALWAVSGSKLLGYTTSQLASGTSAAPAVVLTTAVNGGFAFDPHSNLWVVEDFFTVVEYTASQLAASGSPTPTVTLTPEVAGSLIDPSALAFDAAGNLWVATNNGEFAGLLEFAASQLVSPVNSTPAVTLSLNAASVFPVGMAFDHSGNLWLTNPSLNPYKLSSAVIEFSAAQLAASGSPIPVVTLTDNGSGSLTQPVSLAFDGGGNLWVTTTGLAGSGILGTVVEFPSSQLGSTGSPTPTVTLTTTGSSGLLTSPHSLAFDGLGNLWVSYSHYGSPPGAVFEFAPSQLMTSGTPTPTVTISGGSIAGAVGLAFAP